MAAAASKCKTRNDQVLLRFTCDLLVSIEKKCGFNKSIPIGNSLSLGDIIGNIAAKNTGRYIEFLGVFLQHQPTGVVLIKTKYTDDVTGSSVTQAFSIKRLGIKEAFLKAIEKRAELCGYLGSLPRDNIYIPTPEDLLEFSVATKGFGWVEKYNLEKLYKNHP